MLSIFCLLMLSQSPISTSVLIGGATADVSTTVYALNTKEFVEANPFFKKPETIIASKAIATVFELYILRKLSAKHSKLSKGIALAIGGVQFTVAGVNYYKIKHR